MIGKFFSILLFWAVLHSVLFAQVEPEKEDKKDQEIYSPDIPGNIVIDLGINFFAEETDNMELDWWGSKGIGVYYKYHIMMGKSPFSFRPGLGFGLEKYSFEKRVTVGRLTSPPPDGFQTIEMVGLDSLGLFDNFIPEIKKSKLATDYLELPLDFGWHLSKNDPERGFRILVGGKIGYLFDSKTKINYRQNGFRRIAKAKDGYELNPWRYSLSGRIGISFLEFFTEFALSDLYKSGKGPEGTTARYWKVGISFVGF